MGAVSRLPRRHFRSLLSRSSLDSAEGRCLQPIFVKESEKRKAKG